MEEANFSSTEELWSEKWIKQGREGQGSLSLQSPFSLLLACAECNMNKAVGKDRCIWGELPLGTSRKSSWKTIALKMKETGLRGEAQKTGKEDPWIEKDRQCQ